MQCQGCGRVFEARDGRACPHCGAPCPVDSSGAVKNSLVMIAAGGTRAVYRSVEEVPEPLRAQLLRSTRGLNSATILIADRRGRDEITRAIRGLPQPVQTRLSKLILGDDEPQPAVRPALPRPLVRVVALLLAGAASVFVWLAFHFRG